MAMKKGLQSHRECAIILPHWTGRGAVRLARLHGVQEVPGSIPGAPTGTTNGKMSQGGLPGTLFLQPQMDTDRR
jgi:hypothetical protein